MSLRHARIAFAAAPFGARHVPVPHFAQTVAALPATPCWSPTDDRPDL